jgi:hypothetical protein
MGAAAFATFQPGDQDVQKAFREAREYAHYMHGHEGYSGTIAEKHEVVIIQALPVLSTSDAEKMAWELIDASDPRIHDKWGPAGAIKAKHDSGVVGWVFFGWASS